MRICLAGQAGQASLAGVFRLIRVLREVYVSTHEGW